MDYSALPPEALVLSCLESGNELAWSEFVRRFQPLIASVVLRVSRQWGEGSPEMVDDLVQETYLKLCGNTLGGLRDFKSAHADAIYGYIKVFTANLAHDHFKAVHSQKRGGGITAASIDGSDSVRFPATPSPALTALDRNVLISEIDACLGAVASGANSDRDRRIFWLYYRVGLTANAIAALPTIGLSTKGVETILLRLTRLIRAKLAFTRDRPGNLRGTEGIQSSESL